MIMKTKKFSGFLSPEVQPQEAVHREVARNAAAEGYVLIKNDGALPLKKETPVALFGRGAGKTIKGGTGSGDVNEREVVSIWKGLENEGVTITSRSWLEDYDQIFTQTQEERRDKILAMVQEESGMYGFYKALISNPFIVPTGKEITMDEVGGADHAIYVIGRVAGEGADRKVEAGDYYLTDREKADLKALCDICSHVIVIINTGSQIDLQYLQSLEGIHAIILMSQGGMEGGNAMADVLLGIRNFSGKTTDTWALDFNDFPNSAYFSHLSGNVEKEEYIEDIYVGYRYFDTFGIPTAVPFGFGLSYTTFDISFGYLTTDGNTVSTTVLVKNTGNTDGKEVVQIYASCPQTELPKEHRRLCAFAKTDLLAPGESQELTISFPVKGLASFSETQSAWIMERGMYGIWVGNSIADATLCSALKVDAETILEQVNHICPLKKSLETLTAPDASSFEAAWQNELAEKKCPVVTLTPIPESKPVYHTSEAEIAAKELVEKLTTEDLIRICVGNGRRGQENNIIGSAGTSVPGAAGETTDHMAEEWNVAGVSMADGPAGLRLVKKYHVDRTTGDILDVDLTSAMEGGFFAEPHTYENADAYYQYCTSFPVGTLLAQSWNTEAICDVGKAVAEEMETFGVAWWLAPGMNIHRNPLCGRNFEYFSEDPVVSGVCAAAITLGVQQIPGMGTTIKHLACNNQEDNRTGSDSILTERALREIYLRGFEIAVKTSQPMCIMTSYNLINGLHAANHPDLCTVVPREEWGFQGMIMTDWGTTTLGGSTPWQCISAGNDIIMPGTDSDIVDITDALKNGSLSMDALKDCAVHMLKLIFQASDYENCVSYLNQFDKLSSYITVK